MRADHLDREHEHDDDVVVADSGSVDVGRPGSPPIRRLLRVARPQWARLALSVLLAFFALGSAIALLATSAWLISSAALQPPILTLEVAIVGVRFFGISRGVARYGERLVSHDAVFRSLTRLRVAVYARLARLGPAGLPAYRRGDLLARLVADVDATQDLVLRVLLPYAASFLAAAGSLLLAFLLLPSAAAVIAVALLVGGVLVPWLATRAGRSAEAANTALRGRLTTEVVDVLVGSGDLLAYGGASRAVEAARRTDAELTAGSGTAARTAGVAAALAQLATGLAVVGVLAVAVPAVRAGSLDGVDLAVLALLPLALHEAIAVLPPAALAFGRVNAAARRVFEVVDAPLVVHEPGEPSPLPAGPRAITLRGAGARWRPDAPPALVDVDLDLPPGRRVAVVGPSGAGKSTLAAVLLRFLDHDGTATLDGVDLRDLADDDVRDAIAALTQDAHVFDSTVAENLRMARRDADDAELLAALDAARLTDWVASLPNGLHTPLGAHGTGTSGGEAQRLALARALLADRPVLVLDEPTEHLDPATADALAADLLDVSRGRTTVYVTHRLAGLEQVDEIVVLDGGRVVERGHHRDLMAAGGYYATLAAREARLRADVVDPDPAGVSAPGRDAASAPVGQDAPQRRRDPGDDSRDLAADGGGPLTEEGRAPGP